MNRKFEFPKKFIKEKGNLEMLKKSLESSRIDKEILPILNKFISLPITPRESCYGHPEKARSPYLSYVDDETENERDRNLQKLFREGIKELTEKINKKIGSEAVNVFLEEEDRGGGPKDYTLNFEIVDRVNFKENGKKILDEIWSEFSRYIDKLR